jgi:hypothetical protein
VLPYLIKNYTLLLFEALRDDTGLLPEIISGTSKFRFPSFASG